MVLSSLDSLTAYAIACVLLCLNLMFLWAYSGIVRGRSKTALNAEDAARFGAELVPADPAPVARVLRAHRNAEASIYPFLFLGLVLLLCRGGGTFAVVTFAVFVATRWFHTAAYLRGWQPARSIAFAIGVVCIVALMAGIGWQLR